MTPYLLPNDELEARAAWDFAQQLAKRGDKHSTRSSSTRGSVIATASDEHMLPIVNAFFDIKGVSPVNSCAGHSASHASFVWLWCDEEMTKRIMRSSDHFMKRTRFDVYDVSERVSFFGDRGVRRTIQIRTWGAVGNHQKFQSGWDTVIAWVNNIAWARNQ